MFHPRLLLAAFALAIAPAQVPAQVPAQNRVNQQALDEVAAGQLKVARASWWGFDSTDSTRALQAAIDSKVPKLIVDDVGQPWVVRPLKLVSHQEIEFAKGVEVRAKRGEFQGGSDSLFTGRLVEDVTLRGYGATLRMWRDDYAQAPYTKAEWRHVVQLLSCRNIQILGLTLAESGGDGIYLGTGQAGVTNRDIQIQDVTCDKNYRQGISVITAENLLIENTVLRNTDGTAPRAGIDFEPNGPTERLVNCVMRGCLAENNAGCGYVAYIPTLNATSAPVGLRLENCRAVGNAGEAAAFMTGNTPAAAVTGKLELINCTLEGGKQSAFLLAGNPPTGLRVRLQSCRILDPAPDQPSVSPMLFTAGQEATQDMGGVTFVDCLVRDKLGRRPIRFVDHTGGLRVVDVTGNLILAQDGQQTQLTLTDKVLAEWMPALALKRYPHYRLSGADFAPLTPQASVDQQALARARLRQRSHLVLSARQGEQVALKVSYQQVAKYAGRPVPLRITDWSGQEVTRVALPFQQETEVKFTAPATGSYHLSLDTGSNYAQILRSTHPLNLSAEDGPIHFFGSSGTFHFYVPAGTKAFGIKLFGEGTGEGVKAALYKPSGELFGEQDDIAQAYQFEVALTAASRGEAWSLKLSKATHIFLEDHYVDLLGIPPLLAASPTAMLTPVK